MEWKPIETVPEEGEFLVYVPGERMKVQGAYKNGNGVFVIGGCFYFEVTHPTHWMPLPPPPESKE